MPSIAIRRERLEEILDHNADRQVVLVRGPAGAGKTILVAQWTSARGDPCAWLSGDPSYDGARLLRHLVRAAGQLTPGLELGAANQPLGGAGLDYSALRDAWRSCAQAFGATVNVVLDGADRLRDPGALDVLGRLVEHPPEGARLVLIARSKPRLRLERARLRGDMAEIGPAALRFQRSETEALVSTWAGRPLDAAAAEQETLGWAAGLRLAELEASADDLGISVLREPDCVASEYIREELIEGSSPELRSFLEVTCWLPVLTGPLCAAVASQRTGHPPLTLGALEALPLMPVASRPGAFRYPPILSRVLQHEYRRRDPRAVTSALTHAAKASRHTGDFVTAIELLLQAGRTDKAADICAVLAADGDSSLRRVHELLRGRPEVVPDSPRWLAWRIRAAVASGHVGEASRLLARADDGGADAPHLDHDQDLLIARAAVAERRGDIGRLLATAERLIASTRQGAGASGPEPKAHCWRVRGLTWSGDIDGARLALRALDDAAGGPAARSAGDVALARAWVAWLEGDVAAIAEAVGAAERGDDDDHAAELVLLAGIVHRERNQLGKAVLHLQGANTQAVTEGHDLVAALAASELARCHRVAGATLDALELVVSARSSLPDLPLAVDLHLRSTEARLRLDQCDLAGAHSVIRAAPPGVDAQLLAVRLALQQAPSRTSELLESVSARTRRQAIEKLLLQAQMPGAEAGEGSLALIKAIADGEPLGLVRTFLDEGPTVNRRLADLALESSDRSLARIAALACEELASAPAPATTPPVEQLTVRELAVLRLLPLRMSNREMASQMYISVNTLKTHVRAIYRKLDVPHRSAAVRRAKALQLV